MSYVAGVDYSTHAVDVVLLDEDTDRATWHRYELHGQDAFERTRDIAWRVPGRSASFWDDVVAVGLEEPRGPSKGTLLRVQGAILACIPVNRLVQPWVPSAWRKQVGLPGNATKEAIGDAAIRLLSRSGGGRAYRQWPQDAYDAYCIALATRQQLHRAAA